MANKANLDLLIDNGSGVTLNIVANSNGYLFVQMTDGVKSLSLKLEPADAQTLNAAVSYANAIRRQIPQS